MVRTKRIKKLKLKIKHSTIYIALKNTIVYQ